jgi:hypothetical protein
VTRRIFWTFLALIAVLLVLAVVPLGLSMADGERASFRYGTESSARLVGSAAEELLGDHDSAAPMNRAISAADRQGDCVAVYSGRPALVGSTRCSAMSAAASRALAARVLAGSGLIVAQDGEWLVAAVPVGDTSGRVARTRAGRGPGGMAGPVGVAATGCPRPHGGPAR